MDGVKAVTVSGQTIKIIFESEQKHSSKSENTNLERLDVVMPSSKQDDTRLHSTCEVSAAQSDLVNITSMEFPSTLVSVLPNVQVIPASKQNQENESASVQCATISSLGSIVSTVSTQGVAMPPLGRLVEEPLYVNAKQYHRILKRREQRQKLEASGRIPKERQKYMYESRHRHAMNRVRASRGNFVSNLPSVTAKIKGRKREKEKGLDKYAMLVGLEQAHTIEITMQQANHLSSDQLTDVQLEIVQDNNATISGSISSDPTLSCPSNVATVTI